MRASPWEAVAVKTRVPASEAAMQAAIAECSDSTVMRSAVSSPRSFSSASFSSTGVCGVIGYTGIRWGRARGAGEGAAGALGDAAPAPLAVLRHHLVAAVGPPDGHVGAEDQAVVAVDAAPAGEAAGGLALDLNLGEALADGDEGAHARGRR